MVKGLLVDHSLCSGCRICELACSFNKTGKVFPSMSRITILNKFHESESYILVCRQCEKPACVQVCPSEALRKVNGVVVLNEEVCMGCGACKRACKLDGIKEFDGKFFKCDLCGGSPVCAELCPTGAIKYVEKEDMHLIKRMRAAERYLRED